ncbi:MAG: hypothetical protein R3Y51_06595 [Rikenellaceae bacterium]
MQFKSILLLSALLITGCTSSYKQAFTGTWARVYTDVDGEAISSFCLVLKQDGNKVNGYHFRALAKGTRIDEAIGNNSIEGTIEDGVAIVSIKSGRGAKVAGTAKLEIITNDSIRFTLLEEPSQGEHALPSKMNLPKYNIQ